MPDTSTRTSALSVSEATQYAKACFEQIKLTVIGEVSQLNDKKGYASVFFTIKDENAALNCKMWRNVYDKLGVQLRLGALVQISGYFSIWPKKGQVTFEATRLALAGEGVLRQQVAQLAERLRSEGLMDAARKQSLPVFPERIGLVTSPRGAAVHDVLRTLRRRYPLADVYFAGVPVEGKGAAEHILNGLRCVYTQHVDVILLVRGGGSFEDLMPFNDEALARAMCKCPIPIVTGIGHEPDNSIADMVADFRASTPTAAAEAIAPDIRSLFDALDSCESMMRNRLCGMLDGIEQHLTQVANRPLFANENALLGDWGMKLDYVADHLHAVLPQNIERDTALLNHLALRLTPVLPQRFEREQLRLDALGERMRIRGKSLLDSPEQKLINAASRLHDLSPLAVIGRGYSMVRDSAGSVVRSVEAVQPGDVVKVDLSDGCLDCRVEAISEKAQTCDKQTNAKAES